VALSGNLRDFSLPDVFQLVSFSRKTGTLAIDRGDAKGFVYFRDGEVFFAISNWHREPMGRRLVASDKITDRQLTRALEIQSADPEHRRLGQILVDEGFLAPKILETFVQEQIQDTIFDLFRWEEGDFDFKAGVIPTDEDIGLAVSVENIIMEGSRRLEEWNRIRKKIPGDDVIFRMATAPGEGTFEISLRASEWKLLCLLDGRRTVADLSGLLDLSDFEVSRVLYGMFSGGLLERADAAALEEAAAALASIEEEREPAEAVTETGEPVAAETPDETAAAQAEGEAEQEPAVSRGPGGEAPPEVFEEEIEAPAEAEEASRPVAEAEAALAEEELAVGFEAEEPEGQASPASAAEAATAGPAVAAEEESVQEATPEAPLAEESAEAEEELLSAAFGEEEELEGAEFDLSDELEALTGTSNGKPKTGSRRAKAAPATADVPLHVDKRINKALLVKLIDGVKRL